MFANFSFAVNEQITVGSHGRPTYHEIYRRLAIQIAELNDRLGGLPSPEEAADIWKDLWIRDAHHSTAIEGNTLVLREVEQLLEKGRAVGNRTLREYLEVKGYAAAAEWVYDQGARRRERRNRPMLTLEEVRVIHHKVMAPVWEVAPHPAATEREKPGSFREHDIRPFPGGMKPVSWPFVAPEIRTWVNSSDSIDPKRLTFPEQLANLHCRFEQIHPFLDGNGRTGRLVLNLILVRLGYPPAIIYKRNRKRYLRALRRADSGEPGMLGDLIARAILDSLYRFVIPAVAGPARLVPLAALATPDLKAPALRSAAARGRLQATRGADGLWRSSQRWVDEYKASRWIRS